MSQSELSLDLTKVSLRENPRAGNLGLEKEENGYRSKFPGCYDIVQPPEGKDGRWRTGLDENSIHVNSIRNTEERLAEKERIKKERESLEELTGYDLSGTSKFWEDYYVLIDTTTPLDMSNPLDRIKYHVIMASGEAAPSFKDAKTQPAYRTSKYYVFRENENVSDKVEKKKRYNKAVVEFTDLMEDLEKALLVGKYLDLPLRSTTPPNNVFDIFQTFLDNDEKLDSVNKFLIAVKKSPEELTIKMIFDDAVKKKVIRHTDGLYQRGSITLGKNPKEVLEWLTNPENSGELLNIKDEIELKNKYGG